MTPPVRPDVAPIETRALGVRVRLRRFDLAVVDAERAGRLSPEVRYDIDVLLAEIASLEAALPTLPACSIPGIDAEMALWGRQLADAAAEDAVVLIDEILDEAFAVLPA